jgi:hypothetical protein
MQSLLFLACHKKSYLICDELTNFRILTQPIPNFFSMYKIETAKQGRDSCLKINKYSRFLTSRFRLIAFLMTCQQHISSIFFVFKPSLEKKIQIHLCTLQTQLCLVSSSQTLKINVSNLILQNCYCQ